MVVNGQHPVGAKLKLAIRPERLLLTQAGVAEPGMIEALVRDVVYRGMTAQVYLDSGSQPLLAFVQNTASSALDWPAREAASVCGCQPRASFFSVISHEPAGFD
jgi:ABC-type Fe3+/spermidine/putrescine transport system ATPase subunit